MPPFAYVLFVVTGLLLFAAGWATCDSLKDRRAERAEAERNQLRKEIQAMRSKMPRASTAP